MKYIIHLLISRILISNTSSFQCANHAPWDLIHFFLIIFNSFLTVAGAANNRTFSLVLEPHDKMLGMCPVVTVLAPHEPVFLRRPIQVKPRNIPNRSIWHTTHWAAQRDAGAVRTGTNKFLSVVLLTPCICTIILQCQCIIAVVALRSP